MTTYRDRHLAGEYSDATETEQAEVEESFACDVCGETFATQHGLKIHQGKAHAGEEVPA